MLSNKNILPRDGQAFYSLDFISLSQSQELMQIFQDSLFWKEEKIRIFGKWVMQPRLVAWYGDPGTEYTYSGLKHRPTPWTKELLLVKEMVEDATKTTFNSVLVNLYRNQKDSNGWHSDNEKELGKNPTIASLSLGETRDFLFKHRVSNERIKIPLETGSLLVMSGTTQDNWKHTLPKRSKELSPRINLTFRRILI